MSEVPPSTISLQFRDSITRIITWKDFLLMIKLSAFAPDMVVSLMGTLAPFITLFLFFC